MLVFMVRGLFSRLRFPYAQFPCSAVTGDLLNNPFWEAVFRLERMEFKVLVLITGPRYFIYILFYTFRFWLLPLMVPQSTTGWCKSTIWRRNWFLKYATFMLRTTETCFLYRCPSSHQNCEKLLVIQCKITMGMYHAATCIHVLVLMRLYCWCFNLALPQMYRTMGRKYPGVILWHCMSKTLESHLVLPWYRSCHMSTFIWHLLLRCV